MAISKITSASIQDGTIDAADINDGTITQAKLSNQIVFGPRITTINVANSGYTTLDDTAVNVGGGYIVITGSGFTETPQILIDNVTACSVTYVSSTELRAQVPAKSAGSYTVYVVNSDGSAAISVNGLTYSPNPTWVTSSPLTSQVIDAYFSIQLNATGATSYALSSGSTLPTGVSLAANGLLTGAVTGIEDDITYNFSIDAIDDENQESVKALSITVSGQYVITRSLRLSSTDGSYLSRTPSEAGNRRIFTYSAWYKWSNMNTNYGVLFSGFNGSNDQDVLYFNNGKDHQLTLRWDAESFIVLQSNRRFTDPTAWYHIVLAVDTTQATPANRFKIYINGVEETSWATDNRGSVTINSQATGWNTTNRQMIGIQAHNLPQNTTIFNGYVAEVHFVDGTALTPSSFGKYDNKNGGAWVPKTVSGVTYGTNGFYLPFDDNSSTTTLGYDSTANENNWTLNNFSVTAGINNDSLLDSPTPSGTDDGSGGDVSGNYATINVLDINPSYNVTTFLQDGGLHLVYPNVSNYYAGRATIVPTQKVYFEFTLDGNSDYFSVGLQDIEKPILGNGYIGESSSNSVSIGDLGYSYWTLYNNGNLTTGFGTKSGGATMMVAYDPATRKVWFGVNNTWYDSGNPAAGTNPTYTLSSSITYIPAVCVRGNAGGYLNFGQRPYVYTAPSGFLSLNTKNLTTEIAANTSSTLANSYFGVVTYAGNAGSQSITGLNFKPDLILFKAYNQGHHNAIYDSIRGNRSAISLSNSGATEYTDSTGLASFDDGGFTFDGGGFYDINFGEGAEIAAWCWKANGSSTVTNNDGDIESQVSANPAAGFSILEYTGTGVNNATVGHGLGGVPEFIMTKAYGTTANWDIYHKYLGVGSTYTSGTGAPRDFSTFGTNLPTSTVFSTQDSFTNSNGNQIIAYCWRSIEGYSKIGHYSGNNNVDGPFAYCGFRPAFVLIRSTSGDRDWLMAHNKRGYNGNRPLQPWSSSGEYAELPGYSTAVVFTANGFKLAYNGSPNYNQSEEYVFVAFAETPLKYARGA